MVKPLPGSQTDYSKNGMQTRVWGPAGWIFLHCSAQNYPNEPTAEQKESYRSFFKLVGNVLPCRYCRESYQQYINENDTLLDDKAMECRDTFTQWLYNIHKKVNKKLGITDCITLDQVTAKYESFRSKCTKSAEPAKPVQGCTNPSKEGSMRKKCKIKIVDVDKDGRELSQFGKSKSKSKGKIILKSIKKSNKSDKKYMATFETNGRQKVIHFGAAGMSDYTKHKDTARKQNYKNRHNKDLGTGNPARAGYLSMFILWNKSSVQAGIKDYRRRLNTYNKTGRFPTK
jgi:hypothetical protein